MAFDVLTTIIAVAIGAAFLFGIIHAYRTLANVELLVLWWWAAIAIVGFPGVYGGIYVLVGLAGLLMFGLGFFVLLNVRGAADALSRRRLALNLSGLSRRSARSWRLSGGFVAMIGAVLMLALRSAF
jgi:hypothetical protein